MTIRTKLLSISMAGIAIVSLATIAASYYAIHKELGRRTADELSSKRYALETEVSTTRDNMAAVAALAATHPSLVRMVAQKDSENLRKMLHELLSSTGYHVATVSDSQGAVVARGHSQRRGDSVTNQQNVVKALRGMATAGFEQGTEGGFSLRAGQPIRDGDRIIGCLTLGFDFAKSELVDRFKKAHNVETTLFLGDTRVATTIVKEGKRATGTKMQDPKVLETVLQSGNVYHAETEILGQPHDTVYWPAKDADGKITGMFFVGMSRDVLNNTTRQATTTVGLAAVIVALSMAFVVSMVLGATCRRLSVLQQVADSIALGDCDSASRMLAAMGQR